MLSTEFSTIAALTMGACGVLASFWVAIRVYRLAKYCRDAVEFVTNQNKNAVSLRRMAEVEATLTELLDSYDALLASHKKLRARISMREGRKKRNSAQDELPLEPAPATELERARYKSDLRERAKSQGLLK